METTKLSKSQKSYLTHLNKKMRSWWEQLERKKLYFLTGRKPESADDSNDTSKNKKADS